MLHFYYNINAIKNYNLLSKYMTYITYICFVSKYLIIYTFKKKNFATLLENFFSYSFDEILIYSPKKAKYNDCKLHIHIIDDFKL